VGVGREEGRAARERPHVQVVHLAHAFEPARPYGPGRRGAGGGEKKHYVAAVRPAQELRLR
jgi:hypothetical protein